MEGYMPSPPVKVGDEFNVTMESTGSKGDVLTHISKFTIFVPGTKVGDAVKIKITKVLDRVGFAEVINP